MKLKNSLKLGLLLTRVWLVLVCILWLFPVEKVWGYTESDLWILEVSVNQSNTRALDALVVGEKVYLPVKAVAALLDIPLSVAQNGQTISFLRPSDKAKVYIEPESRMITVNGGGENLREALQVIAGESFVLISALESMTNAVFEYDYLHMAVRIRAAIPESASKSSPRQATSSGETTVERPPFLTVDGVHYRWATEALATNKGNDLKSVLNVWADGTLGNWHYQARTYSQLARENPYGLEQSYLSYDLDEATFRLGQATIQTGPQLGLEQVDYLGICLVSHISPVQRMAGNLVNITGEAEGGSRVKLFVNQWAVAEQTVDATTGRYLFKDVQLPQANSVNEVKVQIVKPTGEVEERYRYISVSEAILNKNEVNYLIQAGKRNLLDSEVFLNTIAYWGVTDRATLGLAWYWKIPNGLRRQADLLDYSFNSLQYSQRLNDNWVFKGIIYRAVDKAQNQGDTGYALNLSYKDQTTMVGFDYEKEGRVFQSKLERPEEVFKVSCVQNFPSLGLLEGKAIYAKGIEHPTEIRKIGDLGYRLKKNRWETTLNLKSELVDRQAVNWQTNLDTTNSFLLTPNFKLVQNFNYGAYWNAGLTENLSLGLKGELVAGLSSYRLGVDMKGSLNDANRNILSQLTTTYSLTALRRFKLSPDETLNLEAGLQHEVNKSGYTDRVPLNVHYYHTFANQMNLEVEYRGTFEKTGNHLSSEHTLSLVLDGAFNIFGKRIMGISPTTISPPGGIVMGVVFKDINHNGQCDPGEPVLSGIQVFLDNRGMITDEKGNFCFRDVTPGTHRVGLDYSKLPVEYTPSTDEQQVIVKANGEARCNLGVYVVGAVDGMVHVAALPADVSLAGIKVILAPGERTATTDSRGYYYFDQLPPGEYTLRLAPATLPDNVVMVGAEPKLKIGGPSSPTGQQGEKLEDQSSDSALVQGTVITFRITEAGEYIKDVNFYLHYRLQSVQAVTPEELDEKMPQANQSNGDDAPDASYKPGQASSRYSILDDSTTAPDSAQSKEAVDATDTNVSPNPEKATCPAEPPNPKDPDAHEPGKELASVLVVNFQTKQGIFNGEMVSIYPFFINDGQVWVPLRVVCQLFNCKVLWNPFYEIICIINRDRHVILGVEGDHVFVDGEKVALQVRSRLINGFTFINMLDLEIFGFTGAMADQDKLVIRQK